MPTFRPDDVVDPDRPSFGADLDRLAKVTGEDTTTWAGYLAALRARRAAFVAAGATASDHGHPTAVTADLPRAEAEALFRRVRAGEAEPGDAERFRGQMLVEMAAMSLDDGLVLQLHAGSWRGHNPSLAARFGADKGADIPKPMDYVGALKPLLDRFGNEPSLTVVVYTLDESTYSRELAPLAGHYPALRLGPPWWFHDSPEGIRRFRQLVTETAGFANTVGFNDDARSLLSIPARHDMVRRVDAGFLAGLVAEGRLRDDEAAEVADDLAYGLARRAFKLDSARDDAESCSSASWEPASRPSAASSPTPPAGSWSTSTSPSPPGRARPSESCGRRAVRPPTAASRAAEVLDALRRDDVVVAAPGGVVMDPEVRAGAEGRARRLVADEPEHAGDAGARR